MEDKSNEINSIIYTQSKDEAQAPQSEPLPEAEENAGKQLPPEKIEPEPIPLKLTFAGDIMAHSENFLTSNYQSIYDDIKSILQNDDFSFANLETPVDDNKPYQSYPNFNVHSEYADAAINAGFDVFSLANNHTGDQGKSGIEQTYSYFLTKRPESIYFSGIKPKNISTVDLDNKTNLTYQIIQKNGWTILFTAVTELLNSYTNSDIINYIQPNSKGRSLFAKQISELRALHPCDVFIVSIHTNEAEYERKVRPAVKEFYYTLLDSGADIIWANHSHVLQEWEVISEEPVSENKTSETSNSIISSPANSNIALSGNKVIFYSLGNCISGQRRSVSYSDPECKYDYTGDSCLMQLNVIKKDSNIEIQVSPVLITTFIDKNKDFVIKQFTQEFIQNFALENDTINKTYFSTRFKLMNEIQGKIICK